MVKQEKLCGNCGKYTGLGANGELADFCVPCLDEFPALPSRVPSRAKEPLCSPIDEKSALAYASASALALGQTGREGRGRANVESRAEAPSEPLGSRPKSSTDDPDVTSYGKPAVDLSRHFGVATTETVAPSRAQKPLEAPSAPSEPVTRPVAPVAPQRPQKGRESVSEEKVSERFEEIDGLVRQWRDGEDVLLVPVRLPRLPDSASNNHAAVARFAAIVKGLCLGVDEPCPLLLGQKWVAGWLADPEMARRCGLRRPISKRTVGRCVKDLHAMGILVFVGTCNTGQVRDAHLYQLATP